MNMISIFSRSRFQFFWVNTQRWTSWMQVILFSMFWGVAMLSSTAAAPFHVPTTGTRRLWFPYLPTNTSSFLGFDGSHPKGHDQISFTSRNFIFLYYRRYKSRQTRIMNSECLHSTTTISNTGPSCLISTPPFPPISSILKQIPNLVSPHTSILQHTFL